MDCRPRIPWSLATYNAQRISSKRSWRDIFAVLSCMIVGIQGHGILAASASLDGKLDCVHFFCATHYIWSWPWRSVTYSNHSAGVATGLSTSRFRESDVREMFTPPCCLARGGGMRVTRRPGYDFTVFAVYLPPHPNYPQDRARIMLLLQWLDRTMCELPTRTTPFLLMDANAHFRSEGPDDPVAGPFGQEQQN